MWNIPSVTHVRNSRTPSLQRLKFSERLDGFSIIFHQVQNECIMYMAALTDAVFICGHRFYGECLQI